MQDLKEEYRHYHTDGFNAVVTGIIIIGILVTLFIVK